MRAYPFLCLPFSALLRSILFKIYTTEICTDTKAGLCITNVRVTTGFGKAGWQHRMGKCNMQWNFSFLKQVFKEVFSVVWKGHVPLCTGARTSRLTPSCHVSWSCGTLASPYPSVSCTPRTWLLYYLLFQTWGVRTDIHIVIAHADGSPYAGRPWHPLHCGLSAPADEGIWHVSWQCRHQLLGNDQEPSLARTCRWVLPALCWILWLTHPIAESLGSPLRCIYIEKMTLFSSCLQRGVNKSS